jgi:hypothetical protein
VPRHKRVELLFTDDELQETWTHERVRPSPEARELAEQFVKKLDDPDDSDSTGISDDRDS